MKGAAMTYDLKAVFRAGAVLALCLAAGCKFKNSPPDTPAMPTGPTLLSLDSTSYVSASYVSSATDPDGDSVYLGISSDYGGYPSDNWSRLVGSGDTVITQFEWYNSGTYKIRVRALDEHGSYSDWSQWLTITVEPTAGRMKGEFRQGPDTKKESR
jgi:predicted phage tail protein